MLQLATKCAIVSLLFQVSFAALFVVGPDVGEINLADGTITTTINASTTDPLYSYTYSGMLRVHKLDGHRFSTDL